MKTNRLILLLFILLPAYVLADNRFQELYTNIHQFISQQKAEVGVAIIADGKDTITVENNRRYPLMSVFKLHQALAVGDYCKKHQISFDTLLTVDSTDLQPNTYSPLRDRYPHGGKFSLKQLIEYTLHLSDNNEDDMHRNLNLGYENWSTPLATAEVIEALLTRTLFDKPHQEFIKEALITCQTGTSRIVHPLQDKQVTVGHKTGTGDRNASGRLIAINDAGFVQFPNGHRYILVVFVKDSQKSMEDTEAIIAQISEMVYQAFSKP